MPLMLPLDAGAMMQLMVLIVEEEGMRDCGTRFWGELRARLTDPVYSSLVTRLRQEKLIDIKSGRHGKHELGIPSLCACLRSQRPDQFKHTRTYRQSDTR